MNYKDVLFVDLNSGSYLKSNYGLEIFNLVKNDVDGKYYGYCPAYGSINLSNFTNDKKAKEYSGVLVVYVQSQPKSKNREVIGLCPNSTVYKDNQINKDINRNFMDKDGKIQTAEYSIVSDTLLLIENYCEKFVIDRKLYSNNMFRAQRVYGNRYPKLSEEILKYYNRIKQLKEMEDDSDTYQKLINEVVPLDKKDIELYSKIEPRINHNNFKVVYKNNHLAKSVLVANNFKCQIDKNHVTFMKENGIAYMEGHHLIPCTLNNLSFFWEKYKINIDCFENITCICPNCHRAIHFGSREEKKNKIIELYAQQEEKFKKIKLDITVDDVLKLYNIHDA